MTGKEFIRSIKKAQMMTRTMVICNEKTNDAFPDDIRNMIVVHIDNAIADNECLIVNDEQFKEMIVDNMLEKEGLR